MWKGSGDSARCRISAPGEDVNKLTKMPLRSNAWTAFAFWSTAGGRAKGFSLKSTEGISNNRRCLAKRHFGQQASERLKPKCPQRALRSPASRYVKLHGA